MSTSSEVEIKTEEQLDQVLTAPGAALIEFVANIPSPLLVLGAGGKMGPTLCVLAKRAAQAGGRSLEVIAVSRFSDDRLQSWLEARDVRTLRCDLLDASHVRRLPESEAVFYLVGLKFGTASNPSMTWAINTIAPLRVAERFPTARIVALSTGNVYPLSAVVQRGVIETSPLTPIGEYGNSAVARERIFEFYSRANSTRIALIRLFYAIELRYGVLVDIARKVHAGAPIELASGFFNCIWQGDANDMILRALSLTAAPAAAWNLCRPEIFSTREVAVRLGELLGRPPQFAGSESDTALLGNARQICQRLGAPAVSLETMLERVAGWVQQGGRTLGKPTHFEVRDGRY